MWYAEVRSSLRYLYLYLMLIFLHVWPHIFTLMHSILLLTAFVTTLLYNGSVDSWVALTSDSKGHFQWPKGGLLSYTNWAPGEPLDNSGPHHNKTRVLTIFSALVMILFCTVFLFWGFHCHLAGKLCGHDSWKPTKERWHVGFSSLWDGK